jgi:hypothetical protein
LDADARVKMSSTTSSALASASLLACCRQSFEQSGPGAAAVEVPQENLAHEVGAHASGDLLGRDWQRDEEV